MWIRFLLCMVLFPGVAFAAPAITDKTAAFIDGTTFSLTGTGFGAKSSVTPAVFDDFDSNDAGRQNGDEIKNKNCSHYNSWLNTSSDRIPTYTNQSNRKGSTLCSNNYLRGVTGENNSPMYVLFDASHQTNVLVDLWFRMIPDANLSGDESGQWQYKVWRIGDGSGENDVNAHFQHGWLNTNAGVDYSSIWKFSHNDGTPAPVWPSNAGQGDTTKNHTLNITGEWQHITIFLKSGVTPISGSANCYLADSRKTTDADLTMGTWVAGDIWIRGTFGWYLGTDSWSGSVPEIENSFDDIYVDNSWASIWIGNASTWSACTHREIQIPRGWDASGVSVTAIANQGSFDDCANVYAFVVDSTGAKSPGYGPFKIGTSCGEAQGGGSGTIKTGGTGTIGF